MGLGAFPGAIRGGLVPALALPGVITRRAFGWQIDLHLTAAQFTDALWLALPAALAAGGYPARRSARAPPPPGLRGGGSAAAGRGGGVRRRPPAPAAGRSAAPRPPPPGRAPAAR